MAHIRKRKNGNWLITIEKGRDPINGKRDRITKTVSKDKNKPEVEEIMAEMILEQKYGTAIDPDDMSIQEFLLMWLEDECEPNLAPRSYERYERVIKKHLIPAIGQIPLQELKPMHVKIYQTKKLKSGRLDGKKGGLSNKTVRMHMHLLSQSLRYAVGLQMLKSNPCSHVKAPSKKKKQTKYLQEEEVGILLSESKNTSDWDYKFIFLALHTGMRRGELLGLKWRNVNLPEGKIYVIENLQRIRNKGLIFKEYPKTTSSRRNIDISNSVIKMLKNHKKEQDDNHLKNDPNYEDNNLVFCNNDGTPINPNKPTRHFRKIRESADITKIRLHDLRHTHASILLKAGIQPKVVQERLGHSSIAITLDIYSHLFPSLQKEAAQKIGEIIQPKI